MSTRDRLRPTPVEAEALVEIGAFLGGLYRTDFVARAVAGRMSAEAKAISRRDRKRALTAVSSSRWAGAITRKVEDQYQLGMRALVAERAMLRTATATIERRLAIEPGEVIKPARGKPVRGYRDSAEWFQKTRRLNGLRHRLAAVEARCEVAAPRVVHGGGRLWQNRTNLTAAGLTESQWWERWDTARWFFTADGETGKKHGNETIRVTSDGILTIKIPAGLPHLIERHVRGQRTAPTALFDTIQERFLRCVGVPRGLLRDLTRGV